MNSLKTAFRIIAENDEKERHLQIKKLSKKELRTLLEVCLSLMDKHELKLSELSLYTKEKKGQDLQ